MMQQQSLTDKASAAQNILHRWLTHACIHTHACMSTGTRTHTCTHTHMHARTYTHTHTWGRRRGGGERFKHRYHYHYHNHWFLNVTLLFLSTQGKGHSSTILSGICWSCVCLYISMNMPLETLAVSSLLGLGGGGEGVGGGVQTYLCRTPYGRSWCLKVGLSAHIRLLQVTSHQRERES